MYWSEMIDPRFDVYWSVRSQSELQDRHLTSDQPVNVGSQYI